MLPMRLPRKTHDQFEATALQLDFPSSGASGNNAMIAPNAVMLLMAMTAVGSGKMPVAEILAASGSVEWNVVEFDACATDVLEAIGDSLTWLVAHGLADADGS